MTIDESVFKLEQYFGKKFTKIYFDRILPSFKIGKSKYSNKGKKEKINKISKDIESIKRGIKIDDILGSINNDKDLLEDLEYELKSRENNSLIEYSSYGRNNKRITDIELEDTEDCIEYIQNELYKFGICATMQTYPIYKISIKIEDVCKFINFINNKK